MEDITSSLLILFYNQYY